MNGFDVAVIVCAGLLLFASNVFVDRLDRKRRADIRRTLEDVRQELAESEVEQPPSGA